MTIRKQVKNLERALNKGIITQCEFEKEIDKMCQKYGTEVIATIMIRD